MRKKLLAAAIFAATTIASSSAFAGACSGASPFPGDVATGFVFCSQIEFMKNRAITSGCGPGLYCPNDFLTRAQMAAFMNTLADTLVEQPVVTNVLPGALALTSLAADNPICSTSVIAATAFPRTYFVTTSATFKMASAIGAIGIHIMYTLDGNTTNWNFATANSQRTSPDATYYAAATQVASISVPAGAAVKVAIGTFSVSGSTAVAESRCVTGVQRFSRTGAASPYDEEPVVVPAAGDGI
jgi:hypothetical protein